MKIELRLLISGVLLIACALIPVLIINEYGFFKDYFPDFTFKDILGWRNYSFSIQTVVGWCYLFSLVLAIPIASLGVLRLIDKTNIVFQNKIGLIIVLVLFGFLVFRFFMSVVLLEIWGGYSSTSLFAYNLSGLLGTIIIARLLLKRQKVAS